MATASKGLLSLAFVLLALPAPLAVMAGDPDILTDFIPPGSAVHPSSPVSTSRSKVSAPRSYALISYPPGSVNPPHTHPRASRLLLVIEGVLSVGFIDTANKLYA
ncbi:hypothetical protein ACP70R_015814 [Stipagrostis hirtigluma subsp. patula]